MTNLTVGRGLRRALLSRLEGITYGLVLVDTIEATSFRQINVVNDTNDSGSGL
jgi:hypothetical protein